jgi:hypothetical protein
MDHGVNRNRRKLIYGKIINGFESPDQWSEIHNTHMSRETYAYAISEVRTSALCKMPGSGGNCPGKHMSPQFEANGASNKVAFEAFLNRCVPDIYRASQHGLGNNVVSLSIYGRV